MTRARVTRLAGVIAAVGVVACRDLATPSDGVASMSAVRLPLPGVVAGDTMRDSTGAVAPLAVVTYDARGDSIDADVAFIVLDTGAHVPAGTALLIGDQPGRTVKVIASTTSLQTLPVLAEITLAPDSIVPGDSTLHHVGFDLISGDTVATSALLSTRVVHFGTSDTSGVGAVIVRYAITQAPVDNGTGPSVVLLNGTREMDRDTTVAGVAGMAVRLRIASITNVISDTAVVTATASYRGQSLGVVEFTVVFTAQ